VRIDTQGDGPILVWFRNDLRLADNPALSHAAQSGRPVIPLYILDQTPGVRPMGAASLWWLDKSLQALTASLEALGSKLILRRGEAQAVLHEVIAHSSATCVLWNRLYDAASIQRDTDIKASLKDDGVDCQSFNAGLLNEPWTVQNGSGQPYKVFTPYWRAAREQLHHVFTEVAPKTLKSPEHWPRTEGLQGWGLHPTRPDWSKGFNNWTPGEAGALERLDDFLSGPIDGYGEKRDIPGVEATSRLSPHLHFGEIGPRQVWGAARAAVEAGDASAGEVEKFLSEIGWREFNHSILFHNGPSCRPGQLPTGVRRLRLEVKDPAAFDAWTQGRDRLSDRRCGHARALGHRLDAQPRADDRRLVPDQAPADRLARGRKMVLGYAGRCRPRQQFGNWQWVAGSGADASPYFRIFNPICRRTPNVSTHDRSWITPRLENGPWRLTAASSRRGTLRNSR
jgi:deoxyribodipyrimidine photo-lyase